MRRAPFAVRVLRRGFSLLDRISPRLAGRAALALWLRPHVVPPKREALLQEAAWLRGSTRSTIVTPGGRVSVFVAGRGPAVLLVHGWAGRAAQLGAFVRPLVEAGYRVVGIDLQAHGLSPGRSSDLVRMELAVRHVADSYGPVEAVVAHSFGAFVTQLALRGRRDVRRMVFLAPATSVDVALQGFAQRLALPETGLADLRRRLQMIAGPDRWTIVTGEATADPIPELAVLHDPGDRQTPYAGSRKLVDKWWIASLTPVPGVGHNGILRDPGVVDATVGFIRSRTTPRVPA